MLILAIETSCDETSIAVLKDGKEILSNIISSQIEIHKEFGGVVPEIASRHHIKNIAAILEEEEIAQANNKHKNQIIINTWNNIKKFIGEGELPYNISLASAYNYIKNAANKQE